MRGGGTGAIQPSAPGSSVSHGTLALSAASRTVRRRWEVDDVGEPQQRIHDGLPGRRHLGVDEELGREPLPVVAEPAGEGRPDRACGSVEAERTCGHERAVLLDDDRNRLSLLPVDQVTQPRRGQGRVRERLAADEVVPAVVEERAAGLSCLRADGETPGRGPGSDDRCHRPLPRRRLTVDAARSSG